MVRMLTGKAWTFHWEPGTPNIEKRFLSNGNSVREGNGGNWELEQRWVLRQVGTTLS